MHRMGLHLGTAVTLDEAPALGMPPRRTEAVGLTLLITLTAALVVAAVAWRVPIGPAEAGFLERLRDLCAPGGEPARQLHRAFGAGVPVVNLLLGAVFLWAETSARLAVRAPDVIAAIGLPIVAGLCSKHTPGRLLSMALIAACPVLWLAVVSVPGLAVDALAALVLYYALRAAAADSGGVRLAALVGVVGLVLNDAGACAAALVAGVLVHRGLTRGDWRLLGHHRLSLLALGVAAALTLTGRVGLPDPGQAAAYLAEVSALLAMPVTTVGAGLGMLAVIVVLMIDAIGRWHQAAAAVVAILLAGLIVAGVTRDLSPAAAWALWPVVLVGLASAASGPGRTAFALRVLLGVLAVVGLARAAMIYRQVPEDFGRPEFWALGGLAVIAIMALAAAAMIAYRGHGGPARATTVLLIGLTLAGGHIALTPGVRFPQRVHDHALVAQMTGRATGPIAVLAPLSAEYWRVLLDRPLYQAEDLEALCAWQAGHRTGQLVRVMLAAEDVAALARRWPAWHAELQSPGTPRDSLMLAGLAGPPSPGCPAGNVSPSR